MISTASSPVPLPTVAAPQALLIVSLENLDVRYASQRAVEWLGLPADRLLGRSLLLSLPDIGQALTLAVAGGLSPFPAPLATLLVTLAATPDGNPLSIHAHRRDTDAILEFRVDEASPASVCAPIKRMTPPLADPLGMQRRLDEIRQDLVALRTRIPCEEAMLRGDDPILFWLWQAEAALAQLNLRFTDLVAAQRTPTGTSRRAP
jgi:hypothetical protein